MAFFNKFEASDPKGIPVKMNTEQQSPQNLQLTLTVKMTAAQVVETSVTVSNNSPIQDYVHPDDQTQNSTYFWNDSWVQTFHNNIPINNFVIG